MLVSGAALLTRRALKRRIARSPLWPLPALPEPISGHSERRATAVRRLLVTGRTVIADGVVQLRLEGFGLPAWSPGAHLDLVLPSAVRRRTSVCRPSLITVMEWATVRIDRTRSARVGCVARGGVDASEVSREGRRHLSGYLGMPNLTPTRG
ncbi:hypothetical protein SCALM49S_01896 [Streptomyces californicus]